MGADLGIVNNGIATELNLNLAATGKIISRGNLFSHVEITGPLSGIIASDGDIGQQVGSGPRTGGITVTGKGNSTGQIIALGNLIGDVTLNGKLSGKIAAKGNVGSGGPAGILGNVTVGAGTNRTAAIVSGAQIGDADTGTILTIDKSSTGIVAAAGPIHISQTPPKNHKVGSTPATCSPTPRRSTDSGQTAWIRESG